MSLFYNLLEEHTHILKAKGYTEKSINCPNREGLMISDLHQKLSAAIRESFRENDSSDFEIKTTGFFNNDRDVVHFKFTYEFNPVLVDLSITALELKCNGMCRIILVNTPDDIPHSSEALELLRHNRMIRPNSHSLGNYFPGNHKIRRS